MLYILIPIILIFIIAFISAIFTRKRIIDDYKGYIVSEIKNGYLVYNNEEIKIINGKRIKEFNKKNIDKYELYVDEKVVSRGKRAFAGALMFGTVGSIVGAVSGKNKISKLGIKLYVNGEFVDINFMPTPSKKKSILYKSAYESINKFIAILEKA